MMLFPNYTAERNEGMDSKNQRTREGDSVDKIEKPHVVYTYNQNTSNYITRVLSVVFCLPSSPGI